MIVKRLGFGVYLMSSPTSDPCMLVPLMDSRGRLLVDLEEGGDAPAGRRLTLAEYRRMIIELVGTDRYTSRYARMLANELAKPDLYTVTGEVDSVEGLYRLWVAACRRLPRSYWFRVRPRIHRALVKELVEHTRIHP